LARLAITKSFLADYARLDRDVRCAVDAAVSRFAKHPDPGRYLEKPQHSWDDRIRTMDVDSRWRGVLLAPTTGDIYCLVTVLPQDKANAYATSRRFSANGALGVLEVRDEEAIRGFRPASRAAALAGGKRLFADVGDGELARLGVDAQVLPKVRLLAGEEDLERLQAALPDAQYAALRALACGMTVDEAWEEVVRLHSPGTPPGHVDPDDLVSAMERSPGEVTFVAGQEELRLVLSHPFAQWRTFLHPGQRAIAYRESYSGPAQVTGGPGTGKTVTLLHRAAFLAARAATVPGPAGESGRVLVTSFNGILADALAAQLDLLVRDCDVRRRIEVLNVDRLAYAVVKAARGAPVIADERMLRTLWADAAVSARLEFTPAFLKNEWEQVILAQDLNSERAYLTCLRAGRGRPLTKAQRGQVWQAAQRVTGELAAARQSTHLQLANEAAHLLRQGQAPRYRHILVDDAQDLHPAQWRLLRAAAVPGRDDLFLVGDPHQRIYNNRVSLASLRISVRGRSHRLSLNYRTTQEILEWAVPLLGTEPVTGMDGEVDSLAGYRSPVHGAPPRLRVAANRSQEFGWLAEQVRSWLALGIEPSAIGVTARSADLVREAREALKAAGIVTTPLSARGGAQAVMAGTMHAMKGLEFQAVAVVGVERGLVPEPATITAESEDPVAYGQDMQRERCVLFVACTRARDHLSVSCTGEPSPFLAPVQAGQRLRPTPHHRVDLLFSPASGSGRHSSTLTIPGSSRSRPAKKRSISSWLRPMYCCCAWRRTTSWKPSRFSWSRSSAPRWVRAR
jgi:UvrD/REP helicase N-terminal domain/UvrD-like helicase C-terminal domain